MVIVCLEVHRSARSFACMVLCWWYNSWYSIPRAVALLWMQQVLRWCYRQRAIGTRSCRAHDRDGRRHSVSCSRLADVFQVHSIVTTTTCALAWGARWYVLFLVVMALHQLKLRLSKRNTRNIAWLKVFSIALPHIPLCLEGTVVFFSWDILVLSAFIFEVRPFV